MTYIKLYAMTTVGHKPETSCEFAASQSKDLIGNIQVFWERKVIKNV